MSKNILYLSCHSTLEHNELTLLNNLEYKVFSPGNFVSPMNPGDPDMRPGIPNLQYDPDILEQYHRIGAAHPGEDAKNHLTKEFVNNFDIVIVMHLPRWIELNWEAMKHKRVIWRTIGQSVMSTEQSLQRYRTEGLEIIRYSPRERNIPCYIGEDTIIRFYKDENEYKDWYGTNNRIITFAQSMKQRGTHCNFDLFEKVTRPFPRHLYGPGNDEIGVDWASGKVPFEQLKEELRANRVYFYTGTHPASYTLNFMESLVSGIPVVAIGPQHGNADWCRNHDLYEIQDFIVNGQNGFISDDPNELRAYIRMLMQNHDLAKSISEQGRKTGIELFGKEKITKQWKEYLG